MEQIYTEHQSRIANLTDGFSRKLPEEIDWDEKLVIILGARGVGKTTLILQQIQKQFGTKSEALYISMDDFAVTDYSILDIATYHQNHGGTHLFIDEIHKYPNWSQELKNIYDKMGGLQVVASGSSVLEINKGNADLSRRAVVYNMPGLSLREYINIETNFDFPALALNDIIKNHVDLAHDITAKVKPLQYQKEYFQHGYYPFYLQGKKNYHKKLNSTINLILEVDMPSVLGMSVSKISTIKKLIYHLVTQVPFEPNSSKLAGSMELNRATLNTYLHYLDLASIISLQWKKGKSYSLLSRPDKILLNNTNLFYLTGHTPNEGTMRETFFANQISQLHKITLSDVGDFLVDEQYIFEVGGTSKDFAQIANTKNSFVVADNLMIGAKNKIPLWLFGFLY